MLTQIFDLLSYVHNGNVQDSLSSLMQPIETN